jgi:excisionase family DNA binding protein
MGAAAKKLTAVVEHRPKLATTEDDTLLTVPQVAALLQVHHVTVRQYIACGDLEVTRLGRAHRISRAALRRFIARRTIASPHD